MSPILVRPVREQFEHDRVIRLVQARYRRRYEVGINPGAAQQRAVGSGPTALYPDVVLGSAERGRRPRGVIEVETAESVNHLEALAQWAPLGRLGTAFYLYVPPGSVEAARRLCMQHGIAVTEIWSYHLVGDRLRFTMVHRMPVEKRRAPRPIRPTPRPRGDVKRRRKVSARPKGKDARRQRPRPARRKVASARRSRRK